MCEGAADAGFGNFASGLFLPGEKTAATEPNEFGFGGPEPGAADQGA